MSLGTRTSLLFVCPCLWPLVMFFCSAQRKVKQFLFIRETAAETHTGMKRHFRPHKNTRTSCSTIPLVQAESLLPSQYRRRGAAFHEPSKYSTSFIGAAPLLITAAPARNVGVVAVIRGVALAALQLARCSLMAAMSLTRMVCCF